MPGSKRKRLAEPYSQKLRADSSVTLGTMADREDWVDALMRLILSLDTTKDHAASPLASLQNVSVASGGIGGMFTQRQGWEAGESACIQVALKGDMLKL